MVESGEKGLLPAFRSADGIVQTHSTSQRELAGIALAFGNRYMVLF